MNKKTFKELRIGDLIARLPIIQGGMGVRVSLSGLASAVANSGGIGIIATAGIGILEHDKAKDWLAANIRALKSEIKKARSLTKGILGVNIMSAITNYADMVKIAIEEKIDIIFSGAGLPLNLPKFLRPDSTTKLVPIVSSGRAAAIIVKTWTQKYNYLPDAIVVEGPLAGGHLGFKAENIDNIDYELEKLIPEVIKAVKPYAEKYSRNIPVIAAGGIYTGSDILKFIKLGAAGVQMGTRFVTTDECDASISFKKTYLNSIKNDIIIIKSPVGMPGRAIRNTFLNDVDEGKKHPYKCPYHCIIPCDYKNSPYCIAYALVSAAKGDFKHGFAFAGANAYRSDIIISVKELMEILTEEYNLASKLDDEIAS